jgi:hypothetical protein
MYAACLVPDVGGSLWDELMGFIDPSDDSPIDDEPQAIKVGAVDNDGVFYSRDPSLIQLDQCQKQLDNLIAAREQQRAAMEQQYQSRHTLRSLGFVFTDERCSGSIFEAMGGVIRENDPPIEAHYTYGDVTFT